MKLDSQQKPSTVEFKSVDLKTALSTYQKDSVFLIDSFLIQEKKIPDKLMKNDQYIFIDANKSSKELNYLANLGKDIIKQKKKQLVVIGGGVLYDIGSFIASSIMKNAPWIYFPTTLFSQVDLAITAKNRIKTGRQGAILGTFFPPEKTIINVEYIDSLNTIEYKSGMGKMLKLHAIDNIDMFACLADDYDRLFQDKTLLKRYIRSGYDIKLKIIKEASDLFNQTYCLNYGENFATAFESASNTDIPPGVALSLGMDLANYLGYQYGFCEQLYHHRLHPTLFTNYKEFAGYHINVEKFMASLEDGNRNQMGELLLVFPYKDQGFCQHYIPNDAILKYFCRKFIECERKL